MDIFTPSELWAGYNRHVPTNVSQLSHTQTERKQYFNAAGDIDGAVVRVYSRLVLPQGITNPPVIILADEADRDIDEINPDFFCKNGFAVLMVDYFGKTDAKSRYTIYPKTTNAYWQTDPAAVKAPPQDPKTSCWYYWTTCLLHAVTYLEECGLVDSSKIGIVGISEGASLVFKASICDKIKAGVTFFCGDMISGSEESMLAFKLSLDSRAYANGCFPILINATTNDNSGAFDYLSGLYDVTNNTCFCVYPGAAKAISQGQKANVKLWFDQAFDSFLPRPVAPELSVSASGNSLYASLETDGEARFFYAENCAAAYRNFKEIIPTKAGEKKYLAKMDIFDAQKKVLIFATIRFLNGFELSTQVVEKVPQKLGIPADGVTSRLIFQAEKGVSGFLVPDGDFFDSAKLSIIEGPHGLEGLVGDCLITLRPGDTRYRGRQGSLLQLMVSCEVAQEIDICLIQADGELCTEYKCTRRLPAKEWTTVSCSASDFKSPKGTGKFENTVGIKILGKSVVLNSLLWV